MNKLLRFNPEPFDLEFEAETEFDVANEGESFEQEDEMRGGRARSRSGQFRSTAKTGGVTGVRPGRMGPTATKRSPGRYQATSALQSTWPKGRRRRWDYRVAAPGWPYADEPIRSGYDRAPSDHVAWMQTSLNDALGLRLVVDGVMNAPTRSAIRLFQERRGLAVNGRMGPETEAALRDGSRRASPPAGDPPPEAPAPAEEPPAGAPPGEDAGEFEWELDAYHVPSRSRSARADEAGLAAPPADIKALRQKIVQIALQEAARWKNGGIQETDSSMRSILQDYWKTGPRLSFTSAQLGSRAFQESHPWSAAFVSWVMRKAGAGSAFKYAASHSSYISAAKANRIADNTNPFKAYRLSEVAPRVGDVVCRSRSGSKATYDTIRPGMKTHCDIVVAVKPGELTVVGGNVANSVKNRIIRTDSLGRVTQPLAFAVIRVGTHKPRMPGGTSPVPVTPPAAPGPAPGVPTGAAPRLLKRESSPPAATLYAEIDLGIVDKFKVRAAPMTGIFLPDGFKPGPSVDVILYLHGHKAEAIRKLAIDEYWNSQRFAYGALREKLNAAGRRAILVAPTLGARSEAGALLIRGGLDAYLAKVLAAVGASGPSGQGAAPSLRHLVLACHSGGGLPMRKLAGGTDNALLKLRECWGFDCTYNGGDDTFWAGWARKTPSARCYFYYIKGSQTAPLSESLRAMRVANAVVQPAKEGRHNYVPITHWLERIQGAAFLGPLVGDGTTPPPVAPRGPSDEPADLKSLSHPAFIAFVGSRAQTAMAATGVPASVTVAQAIVETGWGKHTIGAAKNLFGIKGKGPAGSVRAPTREFRNGAWVTIEADFAKYDSFAQSIEEHARLFLKHKRYAAALKVKDDVDSFAHAIQKAGYATAPDYADQLIKLMKTHNLYRFDRPSAPENAGRRGGLHAGRGLVRQGSGTLQSGPRLNRATNASVVRGVPVLGPGRLGTSHLGSS
jgi:hypothetical protein